MSSIIKVERLFRFIAVVACVCPGLMATHPVLAQQTADAEKQVKITTLKKQMDEATLKVKAIVNQPAPRVVHQPKMNVTTFESWYHHNGVALKPQYLSIDLHATQELPYAKYGYVTSPLNPGYVFPGAQLEFNSQTKFYYIDLALPKKRLSDAEMVEINRLYRIIGDCELKLHVLTSPPLEKFQPVEDEEGETVTVLVPPPKENYVKAAIGVAIVLVLYAIYLMSRKLRG